MGGKGSGNVEIFVGGLFWLEQDVHDGCANPRERGGGERLVAGLPDLSRAGVEVEV